jgi:hypothetical protein
LVLIALQLPQRKAPDTQVTTEARLPSRIRATETLGTRTRGARGWMMASMIAALTMASCGKAHPFLHEKDLGGEEDTDPNDVIPAEDAAYDTEEERARNKMDVGQIDAFLQTTPYQNTSILKKVVKSPADSINSIATKYNIHPLLLLIRLQASQGLISTSETIDINRVKLVFDCGTNRQTASDQSFATFKQQLDCYALALRTSLDAQKGNGATAFKVGTQSKTVDLKVITPKSALTAALYEYEPIFGDGTKGTSLQGHLWKLYRGK